MLRQEGYFETKVFDWRMPWGSDDDDAAAFARDPYAITHDVRDGQRSRTRRQSDSGYVNPMEPLRACVEAFECVCHVVTSEELNWYLVYTPDSPADEASLSKICAKGKVKRPPPRKEVFINYISPIHYNAICAVC